ncbi:hypothetical protein B0H19DRAFT_1274406 [Mycena capillaripes]|nr:hypothetical protein B0H19DRAFT_1274406 [Mycena capillaripes]
MDAPSLSRTSSPVEDVPFSVSTSLLHTAPLGCSAILPLLPYCHLTHATSHRLLQPLLFLLSLAVPLVPHSRPDTDSIHSPGVIRRPPSLDAGTLVDYVCSLSGREAACAMEAEAEIEIETHRWKWASTRTRGGGGREDGTEEDGDATLATGRIAPLLPLLPRACACTCGSAGRPPLPPAPYIPLLSSPSPPPSSSSLPLALCLYQRNRKHLGRPLRALETRWC